MKEHEKLKEIIQDWDTLSLFFEEWTNLKQIIERQKLLEEEDKPKELNYYEIWETNFSFMWKIYPVIYLWFDKEEYSASLEKRRLWF